MNGEIHLTEGGDLRLPNQPMGFYVFLRKDGRNSVYLYHSQVDRIENGYLLSEESHSGARKPVRHVGVLAPAIRKSYRMALDQATRWSRRLNLPLKIRNGEDDRLMKVAHSRTKIKA